MAERAGVPNLDRGVGPVPPVGPRGCAPTEPGLAVMTRRAVKTYFDVKNGVRRTWLLFRRESWKKSDDMLSAVDRVRVRARYEQPLRALAVMAAGAFLAGVLLRVWRSRSYER